MAVDPVNGPEASASPFAVFVNEVGDTKPQDISVFTGIYYFTGISHHNSPKQFLLLYCIWKS